MRLIDADAMMEKYNDWYTEDGEPDGVICTVGCLLRKEPTVEMPRWISVQERLPETYVDVLVCNGNEFITVALYDGEEWMEVIDKFEILLTSVTHWMPLPEPPEEVQE